MPDKLTFPLSEKDISRWLGRDVYSPIRVSSLNHLGIDQKKFLELYTSFFEELSWDPYDPRRLRVEFLKNHFPKEKDTIQTFFKSYYLGEKKIDVFNPWIKKLSQKEKENFNKIQPWRRRSVAQFLIEEKNKEIIITREKVDQFAQDVMGDDFRSLPRVFDEALKKHVENELFFSWIKHIYQLTKEVRPQAKKIRMVAHFMSVKARPQKPGDNSPEGAHEDGADYIVSALVINRINVKGGESQVIEQLENGNKEIIFRHTLAPGEFIFQGDSKDEIIHGTDLWHHVTPFAINDESINEGWRDIIGFDINVVE